jgi:hypothetical protein
MLEITNNITTTAGPVKRTDAAEKLEAEVLEPQKKDADKVQEKEAAVETVSEDAVGAAETMAPTTTTTTTTATELEVTGPSEGDTAQLRNEAIHNRTAVEKTINVEKAESTKNVANAESTAATKEAKDAAADVASIDSASAEKADEPASTTKTEGTGSEEPDSGEQEAAIPEKVESSNISSSSDAPVANNGTAEETSPASTSSPPLSEEKDAAETTTVAGSTTETVDSAVGLEKETRTVSTAAAETRSKETAPADKVEVDPAFPAATSGRKTGIKRKLDSNSTAVPKSDESPDKKPDLTTKE